MDKEITNTGDRGWQYKGYTGCQGKVDVDNTKIFPIKMACIGLVIIAAGTEVVVGNTKNTDCQSK